MPKLLGLQCRECGAEYPLQATHVCEMCFGPLDAVYDYAALKKVVERKKALIAAESTNVFTNYRPGLSGGAAWSLAAKEWIAADPFFGSRAFRQRSAQRALSELRNPVDVDASGCA